MNNIFKQDLEHLNDFQKSAMVAILFFKMRLNFSKPKDLIAMIFYGLFSHSEALRLIMNKI